MGVRKKKAREILFKSEWWKRPQSSACSVSLIYLAFPLTTFSNFPKYSLLQLSDHLPASEPLFPRAEGIVTQKPFQAAFWVHTYSITSLWLLEYKGTQRYGGGRI